MPQPYHERLNFGTELPLQIISHGVNGPKTALPHWHQAVELAYVYRGTPGIAHIGSSTFTLQPQHLYVINSEVVHSFETILDVDNQVVTLLLPNVWLRNVMGQEQLPVWGPLELDLKTPQYRNVHRAIQTLVANAVAPLADRATYLINLGAEYQLVGELVKHLTVSGELMNDQLPLPHALRQAVQTLQENYAEPVAIADLAAELNYSSVYFSRYFKTYLGVSPKAYLGQIRLERAAERLLTTQDPIQEIARQTGFRTEKNFFVTFKQHYQMTPKTYRERYAALQRWSTSEA